MDETEFQEELRSKGFVVMGAGWVGQDWAHPVSVELPDGTTWVEGVAGDDWVTLKPPGWDGYSVSVLAGLRAGRPVVLGMRVSGDEPIRQKDWRTLNLRSLAESAMAARGWDRGEYVKSVRILREKELPRPRGVRRRATSEEVAGLYRQALAEGRHPRQYVAERLGLAVRSVDPYLKRARDEGWLER